MPFRRSFLLLMGVGRWGFRSLVEDLKVEGLTRSSSTSTEESTSPEQRISCRPSLYPKLLRAVKALILCSELALLNFHVLYDLEHV